MSESNQQETQSVYPIIILLILSSILLQKIALPGTGNTLPISTIIMPTIVFLSWVTGRLIVRPTSFLLLSTFLLCGIVSFILNAATNQVSFSALFLLTLVQFPLIFGLRPGSQGTRRALNFFADFVFLLSLLGTLQFVSQSLIGADMAFFVDRQLPPGMLVNTYNNLNRLYYGSEIFKSNGIFFAEPSFFSQFIAVAAIIELTNRQRIIRLIGYAAGLLCSYSGTGLIILGIFGGIYAVKSGRSILLVTGLLGVAILFLFGDVLQLDIITSRINEFSTPNSSGHARFISIFVLISEYGLTDFTSVLFGKGPGTTRDYFPLMPFETFDPTWGKLLFEYGTVSFIVYLIFIVTLSDRKRNFLFFPIMLIYLFAGGYLVDASIVTLLLVFFSLEARDTMVDINYDRRRPGWKWFSGSRIRTQRTGTTGSPE